MRARKFFVTMQAEIMVDALTPHGASIVAMNALSSGAVPITVTMRWGRNLDRSSSCHAMRHFKKGK